MSIISTETLYKAIDYYKMLGYEPLDVPMCVDLDVSSLTKPVGVSDLHQSKEKVYIASAEQGFIQLKKDGKLWDGMYQAVTPCYREESILDKNHFKVFLKLELIVVGEACPREVYRDALSFFKNIGVTCEVVDTDEGLGTSDIMCGEVELGSYGVRHFLDGSVYTYGTGMADPRLSDCIKEG